MGLKSSMMNYHYLLDEIVKYYQENISDRIGQIKREDNNIIFHVIGQTFLIKGSLKEGTLRFFTHEVVSIGYPATKEVDIDALTFDMIKIDGDDAIVFSDDDKKEKIYTISQFVSDYFELVETYVRES